MKDTLLTELEQELQAIPQGKIMIKNNTNQLGECMQLSNHCTGQCDGRGKIEFFSIYPGIKVYSSKYLATKLKDHHDPMTTVLQITHCHYGRMGWDMGNGTNIYLGPGDLSLHMMDTCAKSVMNFPLGYYEGLSISIDLNTFTKNPPEILRDAKIDGTSLYQKFCKSSKFTAMPANNKIEHIFSELYDLPSQMQLPYFKLKVQELLLFLDLVQPECEKSLTPYLSEQVEIIQKIHTKLTTHPECRYTIEELSKQYLINTSTLKDTFKTVYGMPIATYMKNYRIKMAAQMLRETNDSIAVIASAVGYENQSKFASAFKDVYQILPTAYRKQSK
ncbi:MAG: AraC family transcriptional regulator [Clostridiales bacterium]|nr:AraC family transcriptional regulator [Clostridiales bacterium]